MAARAARKTARGNTLFALAERQVLALYDAGVLSPAVLHQVIAAYADQDIDWNEAPKQQSVDDRSLHEVVVLTMMPGRALRTARKDFLDVVAHLAGSPAQPNDEAPEQEDDDELLGQLSGNATKRSKPRTEQAEEPVRKSVGFNPLVKARANR